jgi:hypothetical protein
MKQVFIVDVVVILLILGAPSAFGQTATYQGATLQPGDVINFIGGVVTTGHFLTYGHTALYLGVDPQTGHRSFLDFSVTKGGPIEIVFGTPQPFVGRILTEREFLTYNARYHESFDVFRLQDVSLDQQRLLQEAKSIALPSNWFVFSKVCSSAVSAVLSNVTGDPISVQTPDDFVGGRFRRHPQLTGKSINIRAALREVSIAEYKADASGCGLTPIMTHDNLTLGFKAGRDVSVYFTEPVNLEQTKAAMVMTRACWFAEGGQKEDQPCADAFGSMRAQWSDAGFKYGLELDADAGAYDACLRAIRESPNPPKDMKHLNKLVFSYWRDWNVAAKRRQMNVMRELRRAEEGNARHARGEADDRAGRVRDQSYDMTPAWRALEEAKRSRFE